MPAQGGHGELPLETELDLLVLEYLAHSGYDRAVLQLKAELRERREGKTPAWRPIGKDMQEKVKEKMLRALDRGAREEVLKLWDNFVPPLIRRADKNAQKLEFYLNIYFAVYPLHPSNPSPQPAALQGSMRAFKTYLETDGAALAVTPEFLAYYAMPCAPRPPQRHAAGRRERETRARRRATPPRHALSRGSPQRVVRRRLQVRPGDCAAPLLQGPLHKRVGARAQGEARRLPRPHAAVCIRAGA